MYLTILSFSFIILGIYSYLYPENISASLPDKKYSIGELIKAWAIYSIIVGLLLLDSNRNYTNLILVVCFLLSIYWNVNIALYKYDIYYIISILFNLLALLLIFL